MKARLGTGPQSAVTTSSAFDITAVRHVCAGLRIRFLGLGSLSGWPLETLGVAALGSSLPT